MSDTQKTATDARLAALRRLYLHVIDGGRVGDHDRALVGADPSLENIRAEIVAEEGRQAGRFYGDRVATDA